MKTLLFDFETLSTRPDCVVLSMGMLIADPGEKYTFKELISLGKEIKFDIKEQVKRGRRIDKTTLDWWRNQGEEAQRVLKPNPKRDVSLYSLPEIIQEFCAEHNFNIKKSHSWCRGTHFDYAIIENLFQDMGMDIPIPYWAIRDIRTFIDAMCGTMKGKIDGWVPDKNTILHNALHDCINDFLQMQEAVKIACGED